MTEVFTVSIGNRVAQSRFVEANQLFLGEWRNVAPLAEQIFSDQLYEGPPEATLAVIADLPDDHPEVLAIEDKYLSSLLITVMGRIVMDDFGELLLLASNDKGIGALKILRGLYERVVTAHYVRRKPGISRDFFESAWIHEWKVLQRRAAIIPALLSTAPAETLQAFQKRVEHAKARKEMSFCKRCGAPKTDEAWTKVDLSAMAEAVSCQMSDLPQSRSSTMG
jgi:hypothetical protein